MTANGIRPLTCVTYENERRNLEWGASANVTKSYNGSEVVESRDCLRSEGARHIQDINSLDALEREINFTV